MRPRPRLAQPTVTTSATRPRPPSSASLSSRSSLDRCVRRSIPACRLFPRDVVLLFGPPSRHPDTQRRPLEHVSGFFSDGEEMEALFVVHVSTVAHSFRASPARPASDSDARRSERRLTSTPVLVPSSPRASCVSRRLRGRMHSWPSARRRAAVEAACRLPLRPAAPRPPPLR